MAVLSRDEIYDRVSADAASKGARYFTLILGRDGKIYVQGYAGMGEVESREMSDAQAGMVLAMLGAGELTVDFSKVTSSPLIEYEDRDGMRIGMHRGRYVIGHEIRPGVRSTGSARAKGA